jgi:hypothetical protein
VPRQLGTTQEKSRGTGANSRRAAKDREVVYATEKAKFYKDGKPITVSQAKQWLDWEEEGSNKYEEDYLLKDNNGLKVRCYNNITNRPFDRRLCKMLSQEILRGNWVLNHETIIFGETGLVNSGQHRLVGLILAAQTWENEPDDWPFWEEEPFIESLVTFGASEEDDVVNTLDTGKGRSLSDVIYRSDMLSDLEPKERKQAAKMVEHSVRLLWHRTGASSDAFNPSLIRTHMESLYFIDLHPKLMECVEHIYEENTDKRISKYISPGYASGLLYLMGSAASDPNAYHKSEPPMEKVLDWSLWEKACDFWVHIDTDTMQPLKEALVGILNKGGGSMAERLALLVKTWNIFSTGKRVSAKVLELKYQADEDGIQILAEYPTLGGIDLDKSEEATVSQKVIEERKVIERKLRETKKVKKKAVRKTKQSRTTSGPSPKLGDQVCIEEEDGPIYGTLKSIDKLSNSGRIGIVSVSGVGNIEFPYSRLQLVKQGQ